MVFVEKHIFKKYSKTIFCIFFYIITTEGKLKKKSYLEM